MSPSFTASACLFWPISEMLCVPILAQACCQVMLFDGLPFCWMRPSTASSPSAGTPITGDNKSNSFPSAQGNRQRPRKAVRLVVVGGHAHHRRQQVEQLSERVDGCLARRNRD